MAMTADAEPRTLTYREDYFGGRSHGYKLDGVKVPGVTTLISDGLPKPALISWGAKKVAAYVAEHPELLSQMSGPEVESFLAGVPDRDRQEALRRGSYLHELAEKVGRGEVAEVPEEYLGTVESLLAFMREWDVEPIAVEATVVNRDWKYMGTFDLLAWLKAGGRRRLALIDYKTGASGLWPELALQLAAYAWATTYFPEPSGARFHQEYLMPLAPGQPGPADLDESEWPLRLDLVAGLWLQDDGYQLCPVDAGPDTWRSFLYVAQVAQFAKKAKENGDSLVGAPIAPPAGRPE